MLAAAAAPGRPPGRVSSRSARPVTSACQPGSTTVVAKSSVMRAGPGTTWPGRSPLRGRRSTSAQLTGGEHPDPGRGRARGGAGAGRRALSTVPGSLASSAAPPVTSTDTASTITGLSRIRNEKRWR